MTEIVETPPEDSGWNDRALRLWRETFALIPADEWRPDEVELLRQLCQTYTDLEIIERALVGEPLTNLNPRSGLQPHPLLAERRQLRNLVIALNRNLKLPSMTDLNKEDEDDSFELFDVNSPDRKMTRSESGRKAAQARWAKHRDGGNARRA